MGGKKFTRTLLIGVMIGTIGLSVSSCSVSRLATRGNLPDPDRIAQIKPGEQTREDVAQILGSPSNIGSFGDHTWYYISEQTETTAFLEPKVTGRNVLVVSFDEKGRVAEVDTIGLDKGKSVEPVERITRTTGKTIGVFEQMLGNFGKVRN